MKIYRVLSILLLSQLFPLLVGCGNNVSNNNAKVEATFQHVYWVNCVAYSPDGKYLAAGTIGISEFKDSRSGRVLVWEVATEKQAASLDQADRVGAITFSPDGKLMAVASGYYSAVGDSGSHVDEKNAGEVCLYEVPAWKLIDKLRDNDGISALQFSPDGKSLVTVSHFGAAPSSVGTVWDIDSQKARFTTDVKTHEASVAFHPKTGDLVLADLGGFRIFDTQSGKMKREIPTGTSKRPPSSIVFSPDGKTIIGACTSVMDYKTGKVSLPKYSLLSKMQVIPEMAISPNLRFFARMESNSGRYEKDPRIEVVDRKKLATHAVWRYGEIVHPTAAAFSPDSRSLAVGTAEGEIKVFEVPK